MKYPIGGLSRLYRVIPKIIINIVEIRGRLDLAVTKICKTPPEIIVKKTAKIISEPCDIK